MDYLNYTALNGKIKGFYGEMESVLSFRVDFFVFKCKNKRENVKL